MATIPTEIQGKLDKFSIAQGNNSDFRHYFDSQRGNQRQICEQFVAEQLEKCLIRFDKLGWLGIELLKNGERNELSKKREFKEVVVVVNWNQGI